MCDVASPPVRRSYNQRKWFRTYVRDKAVAGDWYATALSNGGPVVGRGGYPGLSTGARPPESVGAEPGGSCGGHGG
eukprot:3215495-Prymnesium_polylepis.1